MPWSGKRKLKNRFVVTTYFENYLILIRFHMIAAATKKKKKRTRKRKADGQHFSCSIFNDYVISSYLKIGSQPQSCLQWWLQRLFLFSISAARNSTVESSLCDNLDPSVRFFEYYVVSNQTLCHVASRAQRANVNCGQDAEKIAYKDAFVSCAFDGSCYPAHSISSKPLILHTMQLFTT